MTIEVDLKNEHKVRMIDKNEKNKFKFEWLNKPVKIILSTNDDATNGELSVMPGEWIKKIDVSGTVNCQLCCNTIYYGKRGFIDVHLYQVDKFLQSHADEHGNI